MHVGKGQYNDIEIDGETLEKVLEFIYLGSCKTADGDCRSDIMRRIARAKAKTIDLENIWRDRDLSAKLKIRIMKVLVCTTFNMELRVGPLELEKRRKYSQQKYSFINDFYTLHGKTKEHTNIY